MTNEEFINSIRLDGEEWRPVVGWEELYMVSNLGRIVSLNKTVPSIHGQRPIRCKLLSPYVHKNGYCRVILCRNAKSHKYDMVHRLVAEAFIPNPDSKPMIDHIDRNRQNNKVENLRWCTLSENMHNPLTVEHCRKLNLGRKRQEQYKPVVAIKNGVVEKRYDSIKSAISDGFTNCGIINCCAGRDSSHYGYKWMYLSDYESLINQEVKEQS